MLGNAPQGLAGEAGHHNGEGTANGDKDTGRVEEVPQVAGGEHKGLQSRLNRLRPDVDAQDDTDEKDHQGQHDADDIG